VRVVVSYDVSSDRRRRRLAKRLEDLLQRVQQSVFEGDVDSRRLERVRALARRHIDQKTDSVRIYRVCARCRRALEVVGNGPWVEECGEDVVV